MFLYPLQLLPSIVLDPQKSVRKIDAIEKKSLFTANALLVASLIWIGWNLWLDFPSGAQPIHLGIMTLIALISYFLLNLVGIAITYALYHWTFKILRIQHAEKIDAFFAVSSLLVLFGAFLRILTEIVVSLAIITLPFTAAKVSSITFGLLCIFVTLRSYIVSFAEVFAVNTLKVLLAFAVIVGVILTGVTGYVVLEALIL